LTCLAACAAVAALSLLLSSTPHYDPFAWLVWGREMAHLHGPHTLSGPSWKPLPALLAAPLSVLGKAAPGAWLVVARTGGLMALVFAFRLGRRLCSPTAGAVAVVSLALIPGWIHELALGGELSLLLVLVLGTVDRHLDGRPTQALALGFAAALLRTEVWPFLGLYGLWLWRVRAVDRRLVGALFLVLPVVWFVPDWITLGDPMHGATVARASTEARTPAMIDHPALEVMYRGYKLVPLLLHVLALAAVALAIRRRQWTVVVLAGAALCWVGLVAAMSTVGGYPGLSRFLVPAAALVCLLGAVGVVSVGGLAPPPVRAVVVGLLLVTLLPAGISRARLLVDDARASRTWARVAGDLGTAVRAAGGRKRVACRNPVVNHAAQTELAWILHLPLAEVRTRAEDAGVVFVTEDRVANVPPAVTVDLPLRAMAGTDEWTVYALGTATPFGPCSPSR
jgi:hypothetical protein